MRVLYKALASVGMLALSTAAALGVRHLTIASKKRKEARSAAENAQATENNADAQTEDQTSQDNVVVESDTEIHQDVSEPEQAAEEPALDA